MTKIEWTEKSWNPIVGCTKVSPGCAHCYAETMAKRLKAMGRPEYQDAVNGDGRWTGKITLVPERLDEPLRRKKPTTYFVNSMSDLFHEDISTEVIGEIFEVMMGTPQHTYQILTKRPERMQRFMWVNSQSGGRLDPIPLNIWLGVSVENQEMAFDRIEWLIETPAAVRFLSCEPLLGPIDLDWGDFDLGSWIDHLHWVIVGGESGPKARPMHPDWARAIRDQCQAAGVSFFFKQWGEWLPVGGLHDWSINDDIPNRNNQWIAPDGSFCGDFGPIGMRRMAKVGKKAAGRLLDGRLHNEMPEAA